MVISFRFQSPWSYTPGLHASTYLQPGGSVTTGRGEMVIFTGGFVAHHPPRGSGIMHRTESVASIHAGFGVHEGVTTGAIVVTGNLDMTMDGFGDSVGLMVTLGTVVGVPFPHMTSVRHFGPTKGPDWPCATPLDADKGCTSPIGNSSQICMA